MVFAAKRVAVVTGSNQGIGRAVVQALCEKFPGIVYLTARNEERGQSVVESLRREGHHSVRFHQLDICDDKSVWNLRFNLAKKHGGLDILINNAAVCVLPTDLYPTLEEQVDVTLETNYFGTKRVFDTLNPLLNPGARVVNLGSSAGILKNVTRWKTNNQGAAWQLSQRLGSDDLTIRELDHMMRNYMNTVKQGTHGSYGWPVGDRTLRSPTPKPYVVSKVGLSALTRLQQKQVDPDKKKDIAVNHVHPGWVETAIIDNYEAVNVKTFTPMESTKSILYTAMLPKNTEIRGSLIWDNCELVDWANGDPVIPTLVKKQPKAEAANQSS